MPFSVSLICNYLHFIVIFTHMLYLWPQESGSDQHNYKFFIWKVSKSFPVASTTTATNTTTTTTDNNNNNNNNVCDYIICILYYILVYIQHKGVSLENNIESNSANNSV